jgi:hypothetical protein
MYAGQLRLLRASLVSATSVALSLATHLIGTGSGMPGMPVVDVFGLLMTTVLLTTVLLTLVLTALSGRRWTLGRSLVALGAGQVAVHAIFTVLLTSPHDNSDGALTAGWLSMTLAHTVAALLIGLVITVNDSALDTYFCLALSRVGSAMAVLSPWRLARLIPRVAAVVRAPSGGEHFARWQRPHLLTDLVVLQCLSRRGPPALALAS